MPIKTRKRRRKARKAKPPAGHLSPSARRIEMVLLKKLGICGSITATPEELAPMLNYSAPTVILALGQLVRDKRISVKRGRGRGNKNRYTLLPKIMERLQFPLHPLFYWK